MMKLRFWKTMACAALCLTASAQAGVYANGSSPFTSNQSAVLQGDGPQKHVVQKGETLYGISRIYNVSVSEIQAWNNMEGTDLKVGQTLIVSAPKANEAPKAVDKPAPKTIAVETPPENVVKKPVEEEKPAAASEKPSFHVVQPGETLFGIAREHGMTLAELKKLNTLTDVNLQVGQKLVLASNAKPKAEAKSAVPANPDQGTELITMITDSVDEDPEPARVMSELEVLAAPVSTKMSPEAKIVDYTDEHTGKKYKRVEEKGRAGRIQDYSTDQTKFYAFHKYLPSGSYIRVDYPDRGQSILCEVKNSLGKEDGNVILLTAKCLEYLRMGDGGGDVVLRYVVPSNN